MVLLKTRSRQRRRRDKLKKREVVDGSCWLLWSMSTEEKASSERELGASCVVLLAVRVQDYEIRDFSASCVLA